MRSDSLLRFGLSLALMGPAAPASAAVFCVDNAAEVRSALLTAESNGEDDTIKIKGGVYAGGSGYAFDYVTSQNNSITVSGGWFDFGMFGCVLNNFNDPASTVLSGSDARPVLRMTGGSSTGAMTVENLTIFDGNGVQWGGLYMFGAGNLLVDRVYFFSNDAGDFSGGARFISEGGTVTLRNSWFRDNVCARNFCAASVLVNYTDSTTPRAFIGNNTVTGNACSPDALPECGNGGIYAGGTARHAIYNNAFFDNGGSDLRTQAVTVLFNNSLPLRDGATQPTSFEGNIDPADPGFVDAAAGDFRLRLDSPLREAGTDDFDTGTIDFDGNPRLNDQEYDIGAFENVDVLFKDGFEVVP